MPKLVIPPSLRHRNFRLLWIGLMVSVAGSQMQLWSLFWHIRTISDQPIAVSGVGLARFLPILFFALIGGVIADQANRRKIMIITQSALALLALILCLLTWTGVIQLWHIYLITALQAIAAAFDLPARQSLVPNLVPRTDLTNAFSMQSIAFDVGSIVGPALSGLVIASFGLQFTYLFNAVSFLAVLAALFLMRNVQEEKDIQSAPRKPIRIGLTPIREGVQFILQKPIILSSMLLDFFATFFSSANTLLPYIAQDVLHVGAVQYGWLSAGQSMGAVTIALIFSQKASIRKQGALLLGAVGVFGVATVIFGLSRGFWLTLAALILVGAADAVSTILRNTIRQLQTPDHIRGRMVSINQIFFMGGPQLGEIEAGLVAQSFGIVSAVVTGGIGCILAAGLVALRWPQLRKFDGVEPAQTD